MQRVEIGDAADAERHRLAIDHELPVLVRPQRQGVTIVDALVVRKGS